MIVTPVSASPARMAALIGEAPRQRGSSEACTFRQPCSRQRQHVRRQNLAEGGDDDQVGGEVVQERQRLRTAERPRLVDRDIPLQRELLDRREDNPLFATNWLVGPA